MVSLLFFFFFQAEDGIRDRDVTGVQTCALPISNRLFREWGYEVAKSRFGDNTITEDDAGRSEERRVGKECRLRRGAEHYRKKKKKLGCVSVAEPREAVSRLWLYAEPSAAEPTQT